MLRSTHYITSRVSLEVIHPYAVYALTSTPAKLVAVEELDQRRFTGDFYGLLKVLSIPSSAWPLNLIANKYRSSADYRGEETIYTVSGTALEDLLNTVQVVQKR